MMTDIEKIDVDVEKSSVSIQDRSEEPLEAITAIDAAQEAKVVRRVDLRLIPASMFIYLLCFLDRANIGNARILNSDTGDDLQQTVDLSQQQYLIALVLFLVAYTVFEVPSNYMLKKFRPSRWIAFLMFGWGICTMLLGTVENFGGLAALRFLLGAFEAGLFPGIVYCLTFWYKQDERAVRVALILGGATLAGGFGGAIAFGIGHIDRTRHLQAWRWLFIIEGVPSCLCAILTFFLYPDFPETSRWLSETERNIVTTRIKGVAALGHARITWEDAKATLLDWRLYLHYSTAMFFNCGFSSISFFLPTIVSGLGYEGLSAQLFTVPPYAIAFVVIIVVSWQGDKRGMRSWGAFLGFAVSGLSFIVQGALPADAFKARYGVLCVAVSFTFASNPPLLSWLTANVGNTGAITLALSLNQSLGQIGQLIGIYIYKTSEAPRYPTGHFTNAGFMLSGATVTLILHYIYVYRNRKLQPGERKWQL